MAPALLATGLGWVRASTITTLVLERAGLVAAETSAVVSPAGSPKKFTALVVCTKGLGIGAEVRGT